MAIPLHVLSLPPVLFADSYGVSQSFYSTNIEELRVPDPGMEPFVAALGQALEREIPAHRLVTVEVDPGDDESISLVLHLAYIHGLFVLAGDSGALLDATGFTFGEVSLYRLSNTLNSSWSQVAPWTIDQAFLDALRAPAGYACAVRVTDFAEPREDEAVHGVSMTAFLRPEGGFDVEWERLTPAGRSLDLVRVDTFAEARDLLMQFVDRAPTLDLLPWQPSAVDHGPGIPLESRVQLPLRRLDAVFERPAGTMVTLRDIADVPLTYGTTAEGEFVVSARSGPFLICSKTFASPHEVLGVVHEYLDGNVAGVFATLDSEKSLLGEDVITVTAMVPPHREEYRLGSSILALHREAVERKALGEQRPVDVQMRLFVQSVNGALGHSLILAEREVEEAELVTLMVPTDTAGVSIERLVHIAREFAVSLVIEGSLVLHNPSRTALEGSYDFPLSLMAQTSFVQDWAVTTPTTLLEAFTAFSPHLTLQCEESSAVPAGERDSAFFGDSKEGFVFSIRDSNDGSYTYDGPSPVQAAQLFLSFVSDPHYLKENFEWTNVVEPDADALPRYQIALPYGTFVGSEENFAALREMPLENPGDWLNLRDREIKGDYFQIDNVGDGRFLVEWGHDLGEDECFQTHRDSLAEALELMELFLQDDRTAFEAVEWTRIIE